MEQTQRIVDEDQRGTAARSECYRALSTLFLFPRDSAIVTVQALAQSLKKALPDLPYESVVMQELVHLLEELESVTSTELNPLADTYTALFDNCKGRSAVSLYEKDYGNGDAKMVWEELIRFYEHFGLGFDVRHTHDWPDHISVQLEFMHYLTFLEAAVPAADRDVYVLGQKDFLSRRLARWVSRFSDQVNGVLEHEPYGIFSRLAQSLVKSETIYLGCPVDQAEHWVPMQYGATTDSQGRTIIPIANIDAIEEFDATEGFQF